MGLFYAHPCRRCRRLTNIGLDFQIYEHGRDNEPDYGFEVRWGDDPDDAVLVMVRQFRPDGTVDLSREPRRLPPMLLDAIFVGRDALVRTLDVRRRHPGWDSASRTAAVAEGRIDGWIARRHNKL